LPIFPSHVSARRLRITVLLHMALYKFFFYIVLYCIEWDRQRDRQTDRQTVEPSRGRPLQMLCLCLGTATRHIIYLGHFGGRPSQPVTWLVLANITTTKWQLKLEGHSVERMYLRQSCFDGWLNTTILEPRVPSSVGPRQYVRGVLENRPKSENWSSLTPRSSATVRRTKKLRDRGNSLALGLQRGVNSISLQCIPWPGACSEWGACLTDFIFQTDFRFSGLWSGRAQKLISSSMSRHLSARKISSKSIHAFLSNLANWQTDMQTNATNRIYLILCRR